MNSNKYTWWKKVIVNIKLLMMHDITVSNSDNNDSNAAESNTDTGNDDHDKVTMMNILTLIVIRMRRMSITLYMHD